MQPHLSRHIGFGADARLYTVRRLLVGGGGGGATAVGSETGKGAGGGESLDDPAVLLGAGVFPISVAPPTPDGANGAATSFARLATALGGAKGTTAARGVGGGVTSGVRHKGGDGGQNGYLCSITGTPVYYGSGGGDGGGGDAGDGPGSPGGSGAGAGSDAHGDAYTGYIDGGSNAADNRGGGGGGGAVYRSADALTILRGYGTYGGSGVAIIAYPTGTVPGFGGTVITSGGWTIHTFTADGVFRIG